MGKTLRRPVVRFNLGRRSPAQWPAQTRAHEVAAVAAAPDHGSAIGGAFAAKDAYDLALRRAAKGGHLVEVTASGGKSSCYLASGARGRGLKVSVVHTCPETADEFKSNLQRTGAASAIELHERTVAAEAVGAFDSLLSFVFLDVGPDAVEREVAAWWPKVERGGMLAGSGYEVARAQVDAFVAASPGDRFLRVEAGTWIIHRPLVVDAMYCINLPARTDRRAAVEAQFRAAGMADRVEFFAAIDGKSIAHPGVISNGQAGCQASHLAVIAEARKRGAKNVVVFEDDIQLVSEFATKFAAALSRCPSAYDVLYVGAICVAKWGNYLHAFDDLLARAGQVIGSHAYMVNTDIEPRLRADLSPMRTWYDEYLMKKLQPEQRCYVCVPYLAAQVSGKSDVSGGWSATEDFGQYVWR